MTSADLAFYLFNLFNVLRLVSYFPQIYRVLRDAHGAAVISYTTWSLWIAANASTAYYAWRCLDDAAMVWINVMNALCCALVVGLTAFKRWRLHRERLCTAAGPALATSSG